MKLLCAALLSVLAFSATRAAIDDTRGQCPSDAAYVTDGYACKFTCSPEGVRIDCNAPGCRCSDHRHYYNTVTGTCMDVTCENMDCAGKPNEKFFKGCESGSRDRCGCGNFLTMDCRHGCMCKNGFCRKNDRCVKRDCEHPFYKN